MTTGDDARPVLAPGARADLEAIVGRPHVLVDPDLTEGYTTDFTRRFHGSTAAVVRPGDTAEAAAVLAVCHRHGLAVTPQGGNTGLVGGGVAFDGAITLSLTRLTGTDDSDVAAGALTLGAGVRLAAAQQMARRHGWAFPVDLAARDSATVGGMVATNAGGLHVMRWGPMRRSLSGIEAVTASGAVVRDLRGLLKDNTGYHWPSLLCGSEGTLAVVTAARVELVRPPTDRAVALLAFATPSAAIAALDELRRATDELSALELVTRPCLELVTGAFGLTPPFGRTPELVVLAEAGGREGVGERLATWIAAIRGADDAVMATEAPAIGRLWAYRDRVTEAIALVGSAHKLDVTVPPPSLAEFLEAITGVIRARRPTASVWLFGHAGDGNIHVNITGVDPDDHEIDGLVLEAVAARGGSISAEHGIGRAKREFLYLNRSPTEISLYRAIKRALDPEGILNPGVLL